MAIPDFSKQTLLAKGVPVWETVYENFPDTFFFSSLKKWREKLETLSHGHSARNHVTIIIYSHREIQSARTTFI